SSALVLIDLQKGILGMQAAPYSCEQIFARATDLSARFRAAGATVVRVRVEMGVNRAEMPPGLTDRVALLPPGGIPADYADFPDDPAAHGDLIVTKRQWGAFYGTDLDARLRRRGIRTIVLGGVATNAGVESTARSAHEHGYNVVLVEDVTSGRSAEMHQFAFTQIFPMLGRVTTSAEIRFK
ncbi:MAG: isochorismatase family protein, partial [Gallionellaceae bacterium]|nr:isochorismatase family protein [Gallionellaceae bacterium]